MRQVRRKTIDPQARTYLLKAKREGIQLSWDRYEEMLPQDGFSQLGLSCQECYQGPCRLNPFRPQEVRTVCGLSKDDLVFNHLFRQVAKSTGQVENAVAFLRKIASRLAVGDGDTALLKAKAVKWGLGGESPESLLTEFSLLVLGLAAGKDGPSLLGPAEAQEGMEAAVSLESEVNQEPLDSSVGRLQAEAVRQLRLRDLVNDFQEITNGISKIVARRFGLGALRTQSINICLDGVSPITLNMAAELVQELYDEARQQGAEEGYNIVLAGDVSGVYDFPVLDQGSVELAVLTGLMDLYVSGKTDSPRSSRGIRGAYHTVSAEFNQIPGKEELRGLFRKAAAAYSQRNPDKFLASAQAEAGEIGYLLNQEMLHASLEQGIIKGICVLGGGSNVKVTGDEAFVGLADAVAGMGILTLTYGNAAAVLGKYGYLKKIDEAKANAGANSDADTKVKIAKALGMEQGPAVYGLGGENRVPAVVELVRLNQGQKIVAIFPALAEANDLQAALALAGAGAKVLTGIRLPVDGSERITAALEQVIEYCQPKDLMVRTKEILGL